jgi:hypothetical protein
MKQKISMLIEEKIVRLARRKAAEESRPLSDLIQDALEQYLEKGAATPRERQMAFHLFCKRPMKIPQGQLRYVLDEDMWAV